MSKEIDRVYFNEAPYVGLESYRSLPPPSEMDNARRKTWTITEDAVGVHVQQDHHNGKTYTARVPWSNVKGIVYFPVDTIQNQPAPSTPAQGGKR